jgi:patatin-like phospholipase/acyl hydrolase
MENAQRPHNLRILALDGGGVKGYTSLLILRRIMRTFCQESGDKDQSLRPCDVFDLIVGTSTGGLIAVMLGQLRMTVDECIQCYEAVGERVFGKPPSFGPVGKLLKGATSSALYSIEKLQDEIKNIVEGRGLLIDAPFEGDGEPNCKVYVPMRRTNFNADLCPACFV